MRRIRQFLLAWVAAVFAANGLLHPLFHRDPPPEPPRGAVYSAVCAIAPETPVRPEFHPDFCPICAGELGFALIAAPFGWHLSAEPAAAVVAVIPPPAPAVPPAASARAPPPASFFPVASIL